VVKKMNSEVKKVVDSAKKAQKKLQALMKNQDWMDEAKKYAEQQGKEVKKLLGGDVQKVKKFLEKERTALEKFQKDLPGEVKKLRGFMQKHKKDFEKLIKNLRRASKTGKLKTRKKASSSKKKSARPAASST
jgi:hypothetical protein